MRIRLFLLLLTSIACLTAMAQNQPGYVKTLGRPDMKGQPLSNVTIRPKGGHNAVVSGPDGKFSILMQGKKKGDPYALQHVQKNGFELNEKIGRAHV